MKTSVICTILLAFLLTACGLNATINTNAVIVASAVAEIADFDLPAGFSTEFSAGLDGYILVSYNTGDSHSHMYLIQSDKETDGKKLAETLDQIVPGAADPQTRMTVIETRPIILRDQEATLVTSEGTNSEGDAYRQVTAAFQGKGGPALLVVSAPLTSWDQAAVDNILASIH